MKENTTPCNGQDCPHAIRRLYRSLTDRRIAGVCGGLADYFRVDSTLVRAITLVLILCGGVSILIYFLFWLLIPKEPMK